MKLKSVFLTNRSRYYKISLVGLLIFSIISFWYSYEIINEIYNDYVRNYTSFFAILLLFYIPIILASISLVLIFRVFIDRFGLFGPKKNIIRFNLVMTFFFITVISFFIYSYIFKLVFDRTIESIDMRTMKHLENTVKNYREEINKNIEKISRDLDKNFKHIMMSQKSLASLNIDNVFIFDLISDDILATSMTKTSSDILFFQRDIIALKGIIRNDKNFEYFILERGVYLVGKVFKNDQLLVTIKYEQDKKNKDILEIIDILQNSNNYLKLKPLITKLFIYFFVYMYLPIIVFGVLVYYLISYQFILRINRLGSHSKDFTENYLMSKAKGGDRGDELLQLVYSYKQMMRTFSKKRQQDKLIAQYDAWKSIAVKIAHEIKNPLTPIQLSVNQIEDELKKNSTVMYIQNYHQFEIIHDRIEFIRKLIEQFFNFSIQVEIKKTSHLVSKVDSMVKKSVAKFDNIDNISLIFKSNVSKKHHDLEMSINLEKIEQVVTNLIQNSIDSIEELNEDDHKIFVITRIVKDYYKVDVQDTGATLFRKDTRKIFEPYYTKKTSGTGLGLAICKEIVLNHKGNIFAKVRRNRTIFTFSLPVRRNKY